MSVFKVYEKNQHLSNAITLLESENFSEHIYACLELRFCIEAIVYQKLLHAIDGLPNSIVETWQPNKAMKMLREFDSMTSSSCIVHFNLSSTVKPPKDGWLLFGEQKLPTVKWLNKAYNKLGSYLHLAEPKRAELDKRNDIKSELIHIIKDLEGYIDSNFLISLQGLDVQSCPVCKQEIAFSLSSATDGEVKKCSNNRCGALYEIKIDKLTKRVTFECKTYDIDCQSCGHEIVIAESVIRNLDNFNCSSCDADYITRGNYEFALVQKR